MNAITNHRDLNRLETVTLALIGAEFDKRTFSVRITEIARNCVELAREGMRKATFELLKRCPERDRPNIINYWRKVHGMNVFANSRSIVWQPITHSEYLIGKETKAKTLEEVQEAESAKHAKAEAARLQRLHKANRSNYDAESAFCIWEAQDKAIPHSVLPAGYFKVKMQAARLAEQARNAEWKPVPPAPVVPAVVLLFPLLNGRELKETNKARATYRTAHQEACYAPVVEDEPQREDFLQEAKDAVAKLEPAEFGEFLSWLDAYKARIVKAYARQSALREAA